MPNLFLATATFYFLILLAALAVGKVVLISYRMVTHRWPVSARYLIEIVEWKKEAGKILFLATVALALAFLQQFLGR